MMQKQTMPNQAGQTAFFGQKTNFLNQCSGLPLMSDRNGRPCMSHIGHNRREKGGFSQTYLNSTYYITRLFADLGV